MATIEGRTVFGLERVRLWAGGAGAPTVLLAADGCSWLLPADPVPFAQVGATIVAAQWPTRPQGMDTGPQPPGTSLVSTAGKSAAGSPATTASSRTLCSVSSGFSLDSGADLISQRPAPLDLNAVQRAFHIAGLELLHYVAQHPDPGRDEGRKTVESVLLDAVVSRQSASRRCPCLHSEWRPQNATYYPRSYRQDIRALTGDRREVGAKRRRSHQPPACVTKADA